MFVKASTFDLMDKRQQEKFNKIISLIREDTVSPKDIENFLVLVLNVIKDSKNELNKISSETLTDIAEALDLIKKNHSDTISEIDKKATEVTSQFNNKLIEFNLFVKEVKKMRLKGDAGKDGKDGVNPNPEDVVPLVLEKIPKPIEETGETIADKLETLKGDKRLDASAIKNLPEATGSKGGSTARNLWQLHDVSIDAPANNEVLKYNSTTNVWENGTGGGGGTVDTIVAGNNIDVDATDPANPIVSVETLTLADISDVTASITELNYIDGVTSAIQTQIGTKAAHATTMTIAGTANQITSSAGAQDLSANRTWTLSFPADVLIPTVLTVPNTGLHLLDSNASHDLIIKPGSNLTADKTLTLTTGDADVILDLTAVTDEYVLAYDTGTNTWRGVASSGGASFGTDNQIPYTNAGGTDFDYSANLTFNGTALALAGNQTISQGTITTDIKALDVSSTWNNGAVAFTGIKLNATQTASASTSLLMDLQRDSTSVFKVAKNGAVTIDPGSGFGSGSSNPVLTLRAMYGTSSFYGTASSALAVTGSFQVDGTLLLAGGISFQATGQTVDLNSGNITNLNQITNNGSLSFIKMYHDYNGAAAQASQGIIMRYANRTAGTYPRAAFQVYNNADSTEIPFMVSSQGFAWLRNSKTDEVAYTIKGATSQTANLQDWIDSSNTVLASVAADGNISVPDEAYGSGWNGSTEVPTKNALYDKIETLGGGSGITRTIVSTSGSATMGATASVDYVYFVTGAHTMSLPSPNTNRYTVKNNHSANITIDTAGAELVEGAASISIAPGESVDIVSDTTNWYVV